MQVCFLKNKYDSSLIKENKGNKSEADSSHPCASDLHQHVMPGTTAAILQP